MPRILALSNMYPPHHYGGYELSCRDVMERLGRRGHPYAVLTSKIRVAGVADPAGEREQGVWRDLDVYWDDHVLVSPGLRRRLALERSNQARLAEAIDRFRPDVVSVWNMGAMSLGLLTTIMRRRLPAVLAVCDDWLCYGPRLDAWSRLFLGRRRLVGRAVERLTGVPSVLPDLGAAGAFCFVSHFTRGRAEEQSGWRFPVATVVYSGIDATDFPLADDAGPPTCRPWQWRLLYVGRIDDRKGIEVLLAALRELPPEARLRLAGRGDDAYLAELVDLAGRLGVLDRVEFGPVPRAELRNIYRSADVFVFPSTWDEPFGLVPVEAMACATPVVGTGAGGSAEFLADGSNCLLVPARDPAALAAAVHRLAGDPGLRTRLVRSGLATAASLSADALADVLEEWHTWAASGGRRPRPADRPPPATSA